MPMLFLAALAAAAPQVPPSLVQAVREGEVYVMRNLITDAPLYTFDRDEPGRSRCIQACAAAWPPLMAAPGDQPIGAWTLIERAAGSYQWAYEGRPVYTFAQDPEPVTLEDGTVGHWRRLATVPAG